MRTTSVLLCLLMVCATASAQSPWLDDGAHAWGWLYHNETFQSFGDTMPLMIRVDYPAVSEGENTAIATTGTPYPLIVFEHAGGSWYDNYDYLFRRLASRGFIVISGCHDSCGDWGPWGSDEYRVKHADLFHAMIALALNWNATPGAALEGHVDQERISLAGHSHGGGALLDALPEYRPANPAAPLAIRSTMMISPCPWTFNIADYPDLYPEVPPLQVVYGARDTDGCVANGQAIGIYEVGSRPRHYTYVAGADHHAFTDAGTMGISTISRTEAQEAAASAIVAFYAYLLNGVATALPYLRGQLPLLTGPPAHTHQFHDAEHYIVDNFEGDIETPSVAIAGVPGQVFINGFLSDAFVDHAAGVALVREQLQRIYPAELTPPYQVVYYEDQIMGTGSVYADALAEEETAGTIATPMTTPDTAVFATWLDAGLGDVIVSAHQASPGAKAHDEPLAMRVCAGAHAIVSDWRNEPSVGSASSEPVLLCASTRFDGTQNFVEMQSVTDLFAGTLDLYNPGWGRSTVGLATDAVIHATSELTVAAGDAGTNSQGLAVIPTDLLTFDEDTLYQPSRTLYSPTGGLEVAWQSAASAGFRETLGTPAAPFNATSWQALSLRVAQLYADPLNPAGQSKNFSVALVDHAGERATLILADTVQGVVNYPFPPGGFGGKTVFESRRLLLDDFRNANPLLDLTQLVAVDFVLGGQAAGRLVFDDIEFVTVAQTPLDTDGDGVTDDTDNCTTLANAGQQDADGDGYGNRCDGDIDNNCITNFGDISLFPPEFLGANPIFDFDSSGVVNFGDYGIMTGFFLLPPGPSAIETCP